MHWYERDDHLPAAYRVRRLIIGLAQFATAIGLIAYWAATRG